MLAPAANPHLILEVWSPKKPRRLAILGSERRPFGAPKMPELDWDLRFKALKGDVALMLAYLAWLVGSSS